jgi:aspartate carbamoyltransferase catalytic subunit
LRVAIVGDIAHSRVARSFITGALILGVKGIRVIAPETLQARDLPTAGPIEVLTDLETGLTGVDVIMALRIQRERMRTAVKFPDPADYFQQYGITEARLKQAKPDAIVLHPGPINREIEIASQVADGPQSRILLQVTHGVAVRMALMQLMRIP